MLTDAEGRCVFRAAHPIAGLDNDDGRVLEAMDGDERLVYHHLCLAGDKGMWTKDLRIKTQLHLTVINKALRSLESRRIIKSVHTVKNSTRKIYMLAELEPAVELTGGPWFTDNSLDTDLIDSIAEVCLRFIQNKASFPFCFAPQFPHRVCVS